MTTIDGVPSLTQYAVMRLASRRNKARTASNAGLASTRVTAVLNAIVRVILHIAGFALLTIAAWHWNIIAGLAVAGISCFVFSTLMIPGATDETEGRRAPDMRTGR